jgi:hypothetical protein
VSFHTYSRPTPSPVQNLRPACDTCEQCHWPATFHGDQVRRIVEYGDDEANTASVTTRRQDVEKGVTGAQQVYGRSVFPEMNVQLGTYPSNVGHIDSPGCFRCHDDNHKAKDGAKISQDCDTCHAIE